MALSPFGVLPSTSPRADSNGPALWPPPTGHDGRTPVIWRKPCQSPWASLKKIVYLQIISPWAQGPIHDISNSVCYKSVSNHCVDWSQHVSTKDLGIHHLGVLGQCANEHSSPLAEPVDAN